MYNCKLCNKLCAHSKIHKGYYECANCLISNSVDLFQSDKECSAYFIYDNTVNINQFIKYDINGNIFNIRITNNNEFHDFIGKETASFMLAEELPSP
jgi:hypothetical protein